MDRTEELKKYTDSIFGSKTKVEHLIPNQYIINTGYKTFPYQFTTDLMELVDGISIVMILQDRGKIVLIVEWK